MQKNLIIFLILSAAGLQVAAQGWSTHNPYAGYVLVDDMWLKKDKNNRLTQHGQLWPGGVVPYVFDDGLGNPTRQRMLEAMNHWQAGAGVTFVPRSGQTNYILIQRNTSGLGGTSPVGMQGGQQILTISANTSLRVALHELGHALGAIHEHQRPDRDQYVTIHLGNVRDGFESAFSLIGTAYPQGPYDFLSVMHYHKTAFADPAGSLTIEVKPPYEEFQNLIGNQPGLSELDRAGMAALYGPSNLPPIEIDVDGMLFQGIAGQEIENQDIQVWSDGISPQDYRFERDGSLINISSNVGSAGQTPTNHTVSVYPSIDPGNYRILVQLIRFDDAVVHEFHG